MKFLFLFSLIMMAAEVRAFDGKLCEEAIAYQKGFNDGREGSNMDSSFAVSCRADLKKAAMSKYQEGFEKGHADYNRNKEEQRQMVLEMAKQATAQKPTTVVIERPGFATVAPVPSTYTKWFCHTEAFGKTYDGSGLSESEASMAARKTCEGQNHSMHCDEVKCTSEVAQNNGRSWHCKMNVFTDTFVGYGVTRHDALAQAASSCMSKRKDSFFCKKDEQAECQESI